MSSHLSCQLSCSKGDEITFNVTDTGFLSPIDTGYVMTLRVLEARYFESLKNYYPVVWPMQNYHSPVSLTKTRVIKILKNKLVEPYSNIQDKK